MKTTAAIILVVAIMMHGGVAMAAERFFPGFRVTSPFGPRIHPIHRTERFHTGIDLVKQHQTPIHTVAGGRVIYARFGQRGTGYGGFGNVVAVKDANGYIHIYAHLDQILVELDDFFAIGHVIGTQGNTGQSTGSHLHYEVRRGGWGTHVDPIVYLERYYEEAGILDTDDHWAWEAIKWVQEAGLMSGYPDGNFYPDEPVTRAQLAVILHRFAGRTWT